MAYSWKKQYLKLTKDQKERGVIFSSALVRAGQKEEDTIHEVLKTNEEKWETIDRLTDVKFFKSMAKDMGWSVREIVRQ